MKQSKKINDGFPTQYFSVAGFEIRVGDHSANPARIQNVDKFLNIEVSGDFSKWCPEYKIVVDADGMTEWGESAADWAISYIENKM